MSQFRTTALAGYFFLLLFNSFLRADASATPSSPSTIHFRSPRGFSIVVPVYVNGNGPFEFLLDTGATITVIDSKLLQSLKLDSTGSGTMVTPTSKTTIPWTVAETVSVGPVTENKVELGVRDLSDLRQLDSRISGVLGQNVLKHADFLLDNRKRMIEFDPHGEVAAELDGERITTSRIATPDSPAYGSTAVHVRLAESNHRDLNFILDSGSASVVLFPHSLDQPSLSLKPTLLMEDDAGNRKYTPGYLVQFTVGGLSLDVAAHATAIGYEGSAVDGLLPTAGFGSVYISNSGGFVIFQPKRKRHQICVESIAAVNRKPAGVLQCQHGAPQVDGNQSSSPSL
jgi:Aspartyl protease